MKVDPNGERPVPEAVRKAGIGPLRRLILARGGMLCFRPLRGRPMTQTPADLVSTDQQHLIHPLHDHSEPVIYVRGCGTKVYDIAGREYLDGLSGLWNVNVGHGRVALAD